MMRHEAAIKAGPSQGAAVPSLVERPPLRMANAALCLAILASITLAGAQDGPRNPVMERFSDDATFYLSFDDHSGLADLSCGTGKPTGQRGQPVFWNGLFGKAMMAGSFSYASAGNLDLVGGGALIMWLSPFDWEPSNREPYLWPFRCGIANGFIMLGRQGRDLSVNRKRATIYIYYQVGDEKDGKHIGGGGTHDWQNGEWHLVVVNWRRGALELSVDGCAPMALTCPSLKPGGGFSLGLPATPKGHRLRMDDAIILNRSLDADEIRWAYEQTQAAQASQFSRQVRSTFKDDLSFCSTFDHGVFHADVAAGQKQPTQVLGSPGHLSGVSGKALVIGKGGASLSYVYRDNLDLRPSGAASLWFRAPNAGNPPSHPGPGEQYLVRIVKQSAGPAEEPADTAESKAVAIKRLVTMEGGKPVDAISVELGGWAETEMRPCMVKVSRDSSLIPWHLVVLNWTTKSFSLSVDGSPFATSALSAPFRVVDFPKDHHSISVLLGDHPKCHVGRGERDPLESALGCSRHTSLLDELVFYRRCLSEVDTRKLMQMAARGWSRPSEAPGN